MTRKSLTIEQRLDRLERAIFSTKRERKPKSVSTDFTGPSGGARLLISQGFFKSKRSVADVRKAFEKNDYHYLGAVIQTTLNRLSTRTGPLASFKEGGKKVYVKRK